MLILSRMNKKGFKHRVDKKSLFLFFNTISSNKTLRNPTPFFQELPETSFIDELIENPETWSSIGEKTTFENLFQNLMDTDQNYTNQEILKEVFTTGNHQHMNRSTCNY